MRIQRLPHFEQGKADVYTCLYIPIDYSSVTQRPDPRHKYIALFRIASLILHLVVCF